MRKIRTPRGRRMTEGQYVALVSAQEGRYGASPCENGHYGCAAWEGGPCSAELAAPPEEN